MKAIKNIMIALSGIALLASCDMDKDRKSTRLNSRI